MKCIEFEDLLDWLETRKELPKDICGAILINAPTFSTKELLLVRLDSTDNKEIFPKDDILKLHSDNFILISVEGFGEGINNANKRSRISYAIADKSLTSTIIENYCFTLFETWEGVPKLLSILDEDFIEIDAKHDKVVFNNAFEFDLKIQQYSIEKFNGTNRPNAEISIPKLKALLSKPENEELAAKIYKKIQNALEKYKAEIKNLQGLEDFLDIPDNIKLLGEINE